MSYLAAASGRGKAPTTSGTTSSAPGGGSWFVLGNELLNSKATSETEIREAPVPSSHAHSVLPQRWLRPCTGTKEDCGWTPRSSPRPLAPLHYLHLSHAVCSVPSAVFSFLPLSLFNSVMCQSVSRSSVACPLSQKPAEMLPLRYGGISVPPFTGMGLYQAS